jgi:hypothetical protein
MRQRATISAGGVGWRGYWAGERRSNNTAAVWNITIYLFAPLRPHVPKFPGCVNLAMDFAVMQCQRMDIQAEAFHRLSASPAQTTNCHPLLRRSAADIDPAQSRPEDT